MNIKILDLVDDNKYLFVIIVCNYDPEYYQSIVVIEKDKFENTFKEIMKK